MPGTVAKIHEQLDGLLVEQRAVRAKAAEDANDLVRKVIADVMTTSDAESTGSSLNSVKRSNTSVENADAVIASTVTYARNAAATPNNDAADTRFIEVDLTLTGHEVDPEAFFDITYNPRLLSMIEHVVSVEGPVRDEVLARRIARAHGWVRTGARIQERVVRLALQHYRSEAEDVGAFFWPKGENSSKVVRFRRPVDGTARSVDEISLTELRALASEMREAGHDQDSGVLAMAREIGLRKLSAISRIRLERAWSNPGT